MKNRRARGWAVNRTVCLILCLITVLSLTGCRGGVKNEAGAELTVGERGTLTGIYEPTPLALPDGFTLADTAQIGTDPENGEILVLAQKNEEVTAEDGDVTWKAELRLMVYDGTGAVVREVKLDNADSSGPRVAAVSPERVWAFCDLTGAGSGRLLEWDASSGKLLSETETQSIKGWAGQTSPRKLITDAGGNLWLSDSAKVVVISPERVWINQFKLNAFDLAALPDGSVWAVSNLASGRGIARLDPETGQYADAVTLWDNAVNAAPGEADGEYRFYYNGPNGICGVREDEEGKPVSEELMTFVNSNVNYNASLVPSEDTIQLSAALSQDAFVMIEWSRGSDGRFRFLPVLYLRGEDLALSSVKEIQIAHWQAIPQNLAWEITQFNRAHTELRVTTLDYTKYNTADDPLAGAKQLTLDIVTGIVSPDMLVGSTTNNTIDGPPDGPLPEMQKHGIALDLTSYLKESGLADDLFGCVKTSFTDGDGKFCGICPSFRLVFLVSTKDRLGTLAERGRWTTEEFFDFIDSLPPDCALHELATRNSRFAVGPDMNAFIDREAAACSFDSPLFRRYLGWLESLPTSEDWWGGEGAAHGLNQWPRSPYLHSGKLALVGGGMGDVDRVINIDITTTGDKNYALIGRPSETGSGVDLKTETGMVVLTRSKHPDACWAFIRACLEEEGLTNTERWNGGYGCGIPALKSVYDGEMEALSRKPVAKVVSDSQQFSMSFLEDTDPAFVEEEAEKHARGGTWYLEPFDPEELADLRAFIDGAGEPFTSAFPAELDEIVQEEISAYFSGMGTAEDCAAKIQSRASIWLAENR